MNIFDEAGIFFWWVKAHFLSHYAQPSIFREILFTVFAFIVLILAISFVFPERFKEKAQKKALVIGCFKGFVAFNLLVMLISYCFYFIGNHGYVARRPYLSIDERVKILERYQGEFERLDEYEMKLANLESKNEELESQINELESKIEQQEIDNLIQSIR
jgi:hypothetical protein